MSPLKLYSPSLENDLRILLESGLFILLYIIVVVQK